MSIQQRLRLYGKPATKNEIAIEVVKLRTGNLKHNVKPLTMPEICQRLSFDSRQTAYNYLDYAKVNKLAAIDSNTNELKLPTISKSRKWERFEKNHPFVNDELVAKWKKDLQSRRDGVGYANMSDIISTLENFCNTLRINAFDVLQSKEQTEQYGWTFIDLYKEGKADIKFNYRPETVDIKNVRYMYSKATRDFMGFHGFHFRKGEPSWFAQKIVNHGKYADKRFTEAEFAKADLYLKEKYGLDSDEYRFFWIGIESCARISALMTMSLDYEVTPNPANPDENCYTMIVYESKTSHIREGKWTKYITRSDTKKSIDLLKARGGYRIYEAGQSRSAVEDKIKAAMVDLYHYVGKISNIEECQKLRAQGYRKTGNFWFDHAAHATRHLGAHYWLAKGHYTNHVFVALVGGWNTVDELIDSYGAMPAERILAGVFNIKSVSIA